MRRHRRRPPERARAARSGPPQLSAPGALPPALRLFRERFAGIEVRLQDLVAHRIHAQVRAGEVDFGIGVRARLSHGLEFVPVLNDRLCAFVPLDHPLAHHRQLTLEQLADQPIILTGRDSSVREQVDALFDQTRLTLNAGMEANYMSTVLALVRQGLGISVLPESAADSLEGLKRISIDHPGVNREIGLISRSAMALTMMKLVPTTARLSQGELSLTPKKPRRKPSIM